MSNGISKQELEAIELLSNSELVKLSLEIGVELERQTKSEDALFRVPLAKAICRELGNRQLKNRLC